MYERRCGELGWLDVSILSMNTFVMYRLEFDEFNGECDVSDAKSMFVSQNAL